MALRIESGTHYLQRVRPAPSPSALVPSVTKTTTYTMRDERTLTTLARRAGGTRSAYGTDGLVAGSERGERWFFWPMGILRLVRCVSGATMQQRLSGAVILTTPCFSTRTLKFRL